MNALTDLDNLRPAKMALEEWHLRLELAACYRLFDHLGWAEMIFNHITVRVPGGDQGNPHYLINPYGLHYTEVTARNLVKIDAAGKSIDDSPHPVNPAGFVIHSAVHSARPDAHCVMHTHTTAGMAVACKRSGLAHDNFYGAMFHQRVAYHDFEGITTDTAECARLVASLGDRDVLILRNHGLLVTGSTLPKALHTIWTLQRACEVQMAAACLPGETIALTDAVLAGIPRQRKPMHVGRDADRMMFDAIVRRAGIRYTDLAADEGP